MAFTDTQLLLKIVLFLSCRSLDKNNIQRFPQNIFLNLTQLTQL